MSFVIGNAQVIEVFKRFRSQIDYGIFLPVQAGAVAALKSDDAAVQEQCKNIRKEEMHCAEDFERLGGTFQTAREPCLHGDHCRTAIRIPMNLLWNLWRKLA